jgi:hypothetical protein
MESYKHSCPFCGQHIEYTVEYCGKQMVCPSCGKTVTFPAIPPGRGPGSHTTRVKALDARRAGPKPAPGWLRNAPKALGFLRDFQHWNVVGQCAVPFLIIGVLLVGAAFVKKKFSDAPAPAVVPAVHAEPEAWQKMADLTKADQAVRSLMKEVKADHAMVVAAEQARQQLSQGSASLKMSAEEQLHQAQNTLTDAHKRLDVALEKYRALGGTVDYRSQMSNF